MSGRRLGRLVGSLLVLTAIAGAVAGVDVPVGEMKLADVVWTMPASR